MTTTKIRITQHLLLLAKQKQLNPKTADCQSDCRSWLIDLLLYCFDLFFIKSYNDFGLEGTSRQPWCSWLAPNDRGCMNGGSIPPFTVGGKLHNSMRGQPCSNSTMPSAYIRKACHMWTRVFLWDPFSYWTDWFLQQRNQCDGEHMSQLYVKRKQHHSGNECLVSFSQKLQLLFGPYGLGLLAHLPVNAAKNGPAILRKHIVHVRGKPHMWHFHRCHIQGFPAVLTKLNKN